MNVRICKCLTFSESPYGYEWADPVFERVGRLAENSHPDANIYVFLTGRGREPYKDHPLGQVGHIGGFCEGNYTRQVCFTRYANGQNKSVVYFTAEVTKYYKVITLGLSFNLMIDAFLLYVIYVLIGCSA